MTIDQIFLILGLILFFGLIFGSVYFLPIFITVLRSRSYGLNLNFKQGKFLVKNHCVKKEFLIGAHEIWKIYPVQLDKLVSHFHAGGDLNNLRIGISAMTQRNKEPNINMLTALDLVNHDLSAVVEKAEKNNWRFEF